jgi:hypothetical protein
LTSTKVAQKEHRLAAAGSSVVGLEDPDGTVLELVQYQKKTVKWPKAW